MKDKKVLPLRRYKDLEDFVCELDGERHNFFPHKTTDGIYIVDLRPYREKKRKYEGQYELPFWQDY